MASNSTKPEDLQPLDMQRERSRCSFDRDGMTCIFAGTKTARDRSRWLLSLLKNHSENIFDKQKRPFQGRTERFLIGQKIALEYFQLRNQFGLPKEDRDLLRLFLDEYITLQVHESMGHPTVQNQSSQEQWKEWGPKISSGQYLVSYAQTEMAHGSALAGLRTTATFCADSDEWEINTPEPSAGKLWIGGSGSSATHAIVMAKLIIGKKDYGMHPFFVALRDPQSHKLLPGRTAIDMGPKKGAPAMDNGYLTFDRVRIPRNTLLSRFQTVDSKGNYQVQNQQGKLLIRGTMTLVRVGLCEIAAHHASRASLIAIRYAMVRRQGSSLPSNPSIERQIIDYPGVQQRLFTAIASSYALTFAARYMRSIYNELQSQLQQNGDSPLLRIVHGYTSVLKPVMTTESYNVIWRCRKSMGGLGFSAASGLTELENSQPDANLTYEGDNNMLLSGPAANFLVKELSACIKNNGKPSRPELVYLSKRPERGERFHGNSANLLEPEQQLRIVGHRAARLVYQLYDLRNGNDDDKDVKMYLDARLAARAARAHGAYFILFAFSHTIDSLRNLKKGRKSLEKVGVEISNEHISALECVRDLYALEVCIMDDLSEYTQDSYLDLESIALIERQIALCMQKIRPNALGLIEAADMDDWYLASPLGSSDGRAYDRMIEFMKQEPLNQSGHSGAGRDENGVLLGFRQVIGRLTHGEVKPWNQLEAERREEERQKERMAKL